MKVIFAHQPFPSESHPSVFLAGPTLRERNPNCDTCKGLGQTTHWGDPMPRMCSVCGGDGYLTRVSWRKKAIEIFDTLGFAGDIYVPEMEGWGDFKADGDPSTFWDRQYEWEVEGFERADVILFWVPRNMEVLPGLTTNVEFGKYATKSPARVVLGRPEHAVKTNYLVKYAKEQGIPVCSTLEDTIEASLAKLSGPKGEAWPG